MKKILSGGLVLAVLVTGTMLYERRSWSPSVAVEIRQISPAVAEVYQDFASCWRVVAVEGEECNYRTFLDIRDAVLAERWPQIFDQLHYAVQHELVTDQGAEFFQGLVAEYGARYIRNECQPELHWRVYDDVPGVGELLVGFRCGAEQHWTAEDVYSQW